MGLTPQEMDSAIIRNLRDKTGNSLEGWIEILETNTLSEKKEIIKFLKEDKGDNIDSLAKTFFKLKKSLLEQIKETLS